MSTIIDYRMKTYKAKYKTVHLKERTSRSCLQIYHQAEVLYLQSSDNVLSNRKQYHDGVLSCTKPADVVSQLCCVPWSLCVQCTQVAIFPGLVYSVHKLCCKGDSNTRRLPTVFKVEICAKITCKESCGYFHQQFRKP